MEWGKRRALSILRGIKARGTKWWTNSSFLIYCGRSFPKEIPSEFTGLEPQSARSSVAILFFEWFTVLWGHSWLALCKWEFNKQCSGLFEVTLSKGETILVRLWEWWPWLAWAKLARQSNVAKINSPCKTEIFINLCIFLKITNQLLHIHTTCQIHYQLFFNEIAKNFLNTVLLTSIKNNKLH